MQKDLERALSNSPEGWGLCRERAEKEAFYEGQGSTGGAFMRMALTTLALLNKLSAHPVIKQSFLQPSLVGSAAYNCLHFLELLVSLSHCLSNHTSNHLPDRLFQLLAGLSNYVTCSQQRNPARVTSLTVNSFTAFQCLCPVSPVFSFWLVIPALVHAAFGL